MAGIATAQWLSPVSQRFTISSNEAVEIGLARLDNEYGVNPDFLPQRESRAELLHAATDGKLYLVDGQSHSDFALFSPDVLPDELRDRYYWLVLVSAFDTYGGEYHSRDFQYYVDAESGELFTEFPPTLEE
jgi:hypothetical protein